MTKVSFDLLNKSHGDDYRPSITTRLLFSLELWIRARLLPWQVSRSSLEAALRLATPTSPASYPGLPVAYVVRKVARSVRHPWLMRDRRCLREGLLGFRFLREAGHQPSLCFGVAPGSVSSDRLSAHCWINVEGETVLGASNAPLLTVFVSPNGEI